MDKKDSWWSRNKPSKRRLIQIYAALLYNANLSGFPTGRIYTGVVKNLCVPGLNCYSCPGAIAACPLGALQNALAASDHRALWYAFGIILLFGMILGRSICGFLCPVGLIQELLHKVPVPKLCKSRFTRALSYLKYVILAVFAVALSMRYALPAFCKYICPAGTLEGAVFLLINPANRGLLSQTGMLFALKAVIAALFVVSAMFVFRAFCRFVCPLGALYGMFARISLCGISIDSARCAGCGHCVRQCKMDIRRPGDHECIQCGECLDSCPEGAIGIRFGKACLRKDHEAPKSKMKRRRIAAWVLALAVLTGAIIGINRTPQTVRKPGIGEICPNFSVPIYGGGEFSFSDAKGKPVVINFWATWCSPCREELEVFDRLAQEYGDEVELVAIHTDSVTEDVEAFIADRHLSMPCALDEGGSVMDMLGGSQLLPLTVVLDGEGKIIYDQPGSVDYEKLTAILRNEESGETYKAESETGEYSFTCVDQNGDPVPDVMLNICSDTFCSPLHTDDSGMAVFRGPAFEYEVHVISMPEGYQADPAQTYITGADYGHMQIDIRKNEQPSG